VQRVEGEVVGDLGKACGSDETGQPADPDGGLVDLREDAKAGLVEDPVSFGRGTPGGPRSRPVTAVNSLAV
jgi:hypothetical protein